MKTLFPIIISMVMIFASCGNNQSGESENTANMAEQTQEETVKPENDKESESCDEFIDDYEEWTDNYIKLVGANRTPKYIVLSLVN